MKKFLYPARIEFIVTNLCNGKCRHCYATKQSEGYPEHIDEALAVDIVRKVGQRYEVESVMTFGGEPMMFPDVVSSIHGEAARLGIPSRELITNGCWSDSPRGTRLLAEKMAGSGVNDIHFSVDAFHQEHIPLDRVRDAVESCIEAGVEGVTLSPCWLVSEDDDNEYNRSTRVILRELSDLPVKISQGNIVEPDGLAIKFLLEFLPPKVKFPTGRCGDIPYTEPLDGLRCISVEPDGRIAVCNDLYIGDAEETDILEIIESYDPHEVPEIKTIVENGLKGLAGWAKKRGIEPDPKGYYNVCHMCTDLRRRASNQAV